MAVTRPPFFVKYFRHSMNKRMAYSSLQLAAVVAVVLLIHLLPGLEDSAIESGIRNGLHIILFAMVAVVVFALAEAVTTRPALLTFVIVAAIGSLAEIAQLLTQKTPDPPRHRSRPFRCGRRLAGDSYLSAQPAIGIDWHACGPADPRGHCFNGRACTARILGHSLVRVPAEIAGGDWTLKAVTTILTGFANQFGALVHQAGRGRRRTGARRRNAGRRMDRLSAQCSCD